MTKINTITDLKNLRKKLQNYRKGFQTALIICGGTGCQASRSRDLVEALKNELTKHKLGKKVLVRVTGCHGFCEQGPIVVIEPENTFYCHVSPEDAQDIIARTICKGELIERLLYTDPVSGMTIQTESEIPFYRAQDRQLLAQNRQLDPCSIDDYIAIGGYSALTKTLTGIDPEKIIEKIKASGLRGRGGGGFPTGRKWAECREAPSDEKYVICNADEGDPGAYMDRSILEGNPHMVLEGMMIGAIAAGAQQGYVYVRNEYPLAVEHIRIAVKQAKKLGLLGKNILGSSFSFDVEIARGGGAFVCGESTALMASLEGKVGEPRPKDIHTVVDG
ncbi:NAD(P)H-dependent oxidoreductase subunit E, partial [Thermodesulfobacteriota bacterium]